MRALIDFADSKDVRSFIRSVMRDTSPKMFQGVFVGYHPLWELLWRRRNDRLLGRWAGIVPWDETFLDGEPAYEGEFTPDWNWTTPGWDNFKNDQYGGAGKGVPPFVIIFRLKPMTEEFTETRGKLGEMLRSGPYIAISEERPRARLYALNLFAKKPSGAFGGAPIETESGMRGTLGGFLRNPKTSELYGATCAHVARVGEKVMYRSPTGAPQILGRCVLNSPVSPHSDCDANCLDAPDAAHIDVALIHADETAVATTQIQQIGPIMDIVPPRRIPRSVQMTGAETGHHQLKARKFGIWQEFTLPDGSCACFGSIFDLQTPGRGTCNAASHPVRSGDSGAWICAASRSSGFDLCGHLIGGDGIDGYATLAEKTLNWVAEQPGFSDLVPA